MAKKILLTEYDYKEDHNKSYQIIKELSDGQIHVVNDGLCETLEIQGLTNALNYVAALNKYASNCVYKIRSI
jgi:hypothetical protein